MVYNIDRAWQLSPSLVGGVRLTEELCSLYTGVAGCRRRRGCRIQTGGGEVDLGTKSKE